MNRNDLQAIAKVRLNEADLLLRQKSYSGAYHLTGLGVECALKACIARATQLHDFPDLKRVQKSWDHDLAALLNTAGLQEELAKRAKLDADFEANWRTVKDWKIGSRYEQRTRAEATDIFRAATDAAHGIVPWVEGTGDVAPKFTDRAGH